MSSNRPRNSGSQAESLELFGYGRIHESSEYGRFRPSYQQPVRPIYIHADTAAMASAGAFCAAARANNSDPHVRTDDGNDDAFALTERAFDRGAHAGAASPYAGARATHVLVHLPGTIQ